MKSPFVYLGADLAQDSLELFAPVPGLPASIANTHAALRTLLKTLARLERAHGVRFHVVCEATGACERQLVAACHQAGQPISVLNPRQVRDFARAQGRLAKTDKIDARLLSQFGQRLEPSADQPVDPSVQALALHCTRREQLIAMRTAEKNRALRADPTLARSHRELISFLDRQIAKLDADLARIVAACPRLQAKLAALRAVKGVGTVSATALLAALPELGQLSKGQAAALAGLAPFNCDSGLWRGQRHIHGGRRSVRQALYMAALVASRHNPVIAAFYQRLLAHGKARKLALTAAMRKLLIHLNSLIKHQLSSPA